MKKYAMLVNTLDRTGHIHPEVYGHFSEHLGRCIYGGIYVGEDSEIPNIEGYRKDVVEAFREIKVPVLRWPGGCFADEYHWKDGVGPKEGRKKIINTNWGGVTEDNSFGTHEFLRFCELVGCEPYINANVGSGTVQEMSEWVEYMTSDAGSPMVEWRKQNGHEAPWKVKYLGVGNESWGCGGNMRPDFYVDTYRRFQSFCKNYAGNQLYKIACGPNAGDFNWTETIMKNLNEWQVNGIDFHNYTIPSWEKKGYATEFDDDTYYNQLNCANYMEHLIQGHSEIMNRYDPDHKVGLVVGEWGDWFEVEEGTNPGFLYQQNTMRDAIVAAIHLNIFNRHADRVVMANLAQAVNVLQSVALTEGEKTIKTPTFHVFKLFRDHQGADAVYCYTQNENMAEGKNTPMLSSSASVKDGKLLITLANCSLTEDAEMDCEICGMSPAKAEARILQAEVHAHNTFDEPDAVTTADWSATIADGKLNVKVPACSVVSICVE